MPDAKIEAGTLTASLEDRVVTGLLLPYGEVGRTNLGRFSVDRGVFTWPEDVSVLNANLAHDPTEPVARFLTATDTDAGVVTSFKVAATPAGDQLLARAADPADRPKLSIEVKDVVLRAGRAVAGKVFGAAFVKAGAFPSATLLAADAGELPDYMEDQDSESVTTETITVDGVEYVRKTTSTYSTETTKKSGDDKPAEDDGDAPADDDNPEEDEMKNSTLTAGAGLPTGHQAAPTPRRSVDEVAELLGRAFAGDRGARTLLAEEAEIVGDLFAALSDVTTKTGVAGGVGDALQPGWLGELWGGKDHQRRYLPLFRSGPALTALTLKAWEWEVDPVMAEWTGDKTAVASNAAKTKPGEWTAKRYAGAHDHARELRDFPNPEYWASYFRKMTESYSKLSDAGVLAQTLTAATPLSIAAASIPAGVPEALVKIVDGYLAMADTATPTAAVISRSLWRDLVLTPKDKSLEYLSTSLGVEDGSVSQFRILPGPTTMAAGSVLVAAREAVEVRELSGTPIRVEGLDMVKGGVDTGLFGYAMTIIHEPAALQLVTTGA